MESTNPKRLTNKERALVGSLAEGKNLTQSALAADTAVNTPINRVGKLFRIFVLNCPNS
jgi:hypothetical protein